MVIFVLKSNQNKIRILTLPLGTFIMQNPRSEIFVQLFKDPEKVFDYSRHENKKTSNCISILMQS